MKLARIEYGGTRQWTILDGDSLYALEGELYGRFSKGSRVCALVDAQLLPPAEPHTIIGCGMNYMDTVRQLNAKVPQEPSLFFKPVEALVGHGEEACSLPISADTRYEAELCAVMKRRAWRVKETEAYEYVLGYTCGNDMTLWDVRERDGRLTRAKGYFKSAPLGPFLVTDIDPHSLRIQSRVNGDTKQDGNTRDQIFSTAHIISHVTQFLPLEPGDVLFTGSPGGGHHPINVGDVVEVEIDGIGILRNRVVLC